MKYILKIIVFTLLFSSVQVFGQVLEIPPPPTGLPPVPPPDVQARILRSLSPAYTIGAPIGSQLSDMGYFIDAEILAFSGTVTKSRASGWINFKNLGWAYLPDYEKLGSSLTLFSPNMGWLEFSIQSQDGGRFYSYADNQTCYFTWDSSSGFFYYYDYSASQWNLFEF